MACGTGDGGGAMSTRCETNDDGAGPSRRRAVSAKAERMSRVMATRGEYSYSDFIASCAAMSARRASMTVRTGVSPTDRRGDPGYLVEGGLVVFFSPDQPDRIVGPVADSPLPVVAVVE